MILLSHIIIALASLVYTFTVYLAPSQRKLQISYGLVGLTVASGTWLIVRNPAHMVSSCVTGLVYLGVVFTAIGLAHYKLAHQEED